MSGSGDEEKVCQVCSDFEPQAWRKSLCRNCFHTLDDHAEDLLAAEAEAVAKEKAGQASAKSGKSGAAADKAKPTGGDSSGKESSGEEEKGKSGSKLSPGKGKSKLGPWNKDLGTEYGKPSNKGTGKDKGDPGDSKTDSKQGNVSKAKAFASKFENKQSTPSDKAFGKAADRLSSSKLSKDSSSGDSKSSAKAQKAEDSNSTDSSTSKSIDSKSKTGAQSKSVSNGVDKKKDVGDSKKPGVKDSLSKTKDERKDIKDSLASPRSKAAAPFGKDMLKSSKKDSKPAESDKTPERKDSVGRPGSTKLPSSPSDGKLKSSASPKQEDKSGNKQDDKTAKSAGRSGAGVSAPSQSGTAGEKKSSSSSSLSAPPSSSSSPSSSSARKEENADGGKINNTNGQLAKFLPGKFSRDGTDSARSTQSDDVSKSTGKPGRTAGAGSDSTAASVSGSGGFGAKQSPGKESTASPLSRDRDKEAAGSTAGGGGGGGGSKVGEKGDKLPGPNETLASPADAKQSTTSVGQQCPASKTKGGAASTSSDSESAPGSTTSFSRKGDAEKPPRDLRLNKTYGALNKFKDLDKKATKKDDGLFSPLRSPTSSFSSPRDGKESSKTKTPAEEAAPTGLDTKNDNSDKLKKELKAKEDKVDNLSKQLAKMEAEMKKLEGEKESLQKEAKQSKQSQKEDVERLLSDLKGQLTKMETQCGKLQNDNESLSKRLQTQEKNVKKDQAARGKNQANVQLEEDLEAAERELEEVREENKELQSQIMEMKNEMDEMHDQFRENEHDEFRELQKELDLTAKNCRILQFKLRKSERRNEQIEEDRIHYEEKLRHLQDQFDSRDAKSHIQLLEEELRVAKEVSVRLHDELDIVEDKKNKALEDNRHLTELLEHTDKRQFRLEMEIDKLRDVVQDLKMQLREAKGGDYEDKDRKPMLGLVGQQGSKEYDSSVLMKDLCDSMERENDLKDQLKFSEEEAKMLRRRVSDMDEENESLRVQLQKMSEKASKHKKKEKEREKELEEERKHGEATRAALRSYASGQAQYPDGEVSSDVILVLGAEHSDVMESDEPIPISQRKDSTDEDLMNAMQLRVQLEMLEQEMMMSHRKMDDMDLENENLQAEVKFLQERLEEKTNESKDLPEPSTPNAYYEDKIKELGQELDDLRWKLIEKDRELERVQVVQKRGARNTASPNSVSVGGKKQDRLKKSKSLDAENIGQNLQDPRMMDMKRQLEMSQQEIIQLRTSLELAEDAREQLAKEKEELASTPTEASRRSPSVPSVLADDAVLENIEFRDKIRRLEDENKGQVEKIRLLTESLHKLSKDSRTFQSIATSPTAPGIRTLTTSDVTQAPAFPNLSADRADLTLSLTSSASLPSIAAERDTVTLTRQLSSPTSEQRHRLEKGVRFDLDLTTEEQPQEEEGKLEEEKGEKEQEKDLPASTVSLVDLQDGVAGQPEATADLAMDDSEKKSMESSGGGGDGEGGDGAGPGGKAESGLAGAAKNSSSGSGSVEVKKKSLLQEYADGKSKVTTTGEESRVELMEKVLDMDDEIGDLIKELRRKEDETESLNRDIKSLKVQLQDAKDRGRRTELELLQEVDMLHDKNSVMSNLLDIINERAEAAEEELERRIQNPSHSPARSASNVSQVSALSDTSTGSDEVFMIHGGIGKEGVLTRDWEAKLKVRIESLERLLAEERQKVTTAEKKLLLAGIDTLSPSVSDDVKLRMREKELLQEELLKNQRHLHIATDQIQGLKERVQILEEEYQRLKDDYAKLYDEIDKPAEDKSNNPSSDSDDKTPESLGEEHPFVAKKISVVEAPHFRELKHKNAQTEPLTNGVDLSSLQSELASYKAKAKELEYQVEEINDIWRSKSNTSDKEKDELEKQLKAQIREMNSLEQKSEALKREIDAKDKLLTESQEALRQQENALARSTTTQLPDGTTARQLQEQDRQALGSQIAQRESNIRELTERIRNRDERLAEKDNIICKLNEELDALKQKTMGLDEKLQATLEQVREKEVMISVLRGQISPGSPVRAEGGQSGLSFCQTDAEKESCRLREAVRQQQVELEKVGEEKKSLGAKLEQSKKATEEAAMLWEGERGEMLKEANILQEKVRMYEAYNLMCRDETIEALKQETQDYFREKEALTCQLSTLKLKHDTSQRHYKEDMAKLQGELSEKLQELKAEVDNNIHLNSEMDKLTRQAELAYRLQQEERLLRAEYQAMKVRYETRIEKMNKEANKMLLAMTKLQKERDLDKDIIAKMQENFNVVKEKYTEELLKAEEDRVMLERHVKEIEESRRFVKHLQSQMRELREKCVDQERLRAELINKFSTDRASWEIDRANLNSTINELKEQISSSSQQQSRSKDIQVNMGMAWDKERREQRRLLQEAHTLALDLQDQLRNRDETFAHERKELLLQLENERQTRTKDMRDSEKQAIVLESSDRKVNALQTQMKEVERRAQRELDAFRAEKVELLKQLAECKHAQSRDYRQLEEVLAGLTRLKELGGLLKNESPGEPASDHSRQIDQNVLAYVKEAVCQISEAADELSKYANTPQDGTAAQFLSETSAVKKEMAQHFETQEGDVVIATDVTSSRATTTSRIEEHADPVSRRVSTQQFRDATGHRDTERIIVEKTNVIESAPTIVSSASSHASSRSQGFNTATQKKAEAADPAQQMYRPPPLPQQPLPVVLRPFDPAASSRRYERPPSYTSGTRSASTSRATTPDIVGEATQSRRTGFPEPPPSFVIPHHRSLQPGAQQEMFQKALAVVMANSGNTQSDTKRARRPDGLKKSHSIDESSGMKVGHVTSRGSRPPSLSASTTPTLAVTSAEYAASFANQAAAYSSTPPQHPSPQHLTTLSLYADKFSPRTARRKFFEEPNLFKAAPPHLQTGDQSRGGGGGVSQRSGDTSHVLHHRQTSLPDPETVRREAEEEHDMVASRLEPLPRLPFSMSYDEKIHTSIQHAETQQHSDNDSLSSRKSHQQVDEATTAATTAAPPSNAKPPSAKEKRKQYKKASSLDATVGTSIAKAGVSAISPGAPSGFTPSDIFAAVKGKLKPVFHKKKSGGKGQQASGSSASGSSGSGAAGSGSAEHTATCHEGGARGDLEQSRDLEEGKDQVPKELPSERSRGLGRRSDAHQMVQDQWRSKSVDRAGQQASVTQIQGDVIRPVQGVWKFNETAV